MKFRFFELGLVSLLSFGRLITSQNVKCTTLFNKPCLASLSNCGWIIHVMEVVILGKIFVPHKTEDVNVKVSNMETVFSNSENINRINFK